MIDVRGVEVPAAEAYPVLTPDQVASLVVLGRTRTLAPGELLWADGAEGYQFAVLLEGALEIVRRDPHGDERIVRYRPGQFAGELSLLTGQRPTVACRALTTARVAEVPTDVLRRLMATDAELGDLIFTALAARREVLRRGVGVRALRIIGSRYSSEAHQLRAYATRAGLAFSWVELEGEDGEAVADYLAGRGLSLAETPIVTSTAGDLVRPTPSQLAALLGLNHGPAIGEIVDLVVVGAGPAGLAAAVYGASEGLRTLLLDAVGAGGQAGSSARIENYLGFPTGVSGSELTRLAMLQAQRLGAVLRAPCRVEVLRPAEGGWLAVLDDASTVHARAVVLAIGAEYRRLPVAGLEAFEGAGLFYAATELEVRLFAGAPVVVVGSGNSAGQAGLSLAGAGATVTMAVRGHDLAHAMSSYLVTRIEAHKQIDVRTRTEVRGLHGDGHLEALDLEHTPTGTTARVPCQGLFSFIGADAPTRWLADLVALDDDGFVLTDRSIPEAHLAGWRGLDRGPLPFETSCPGLFAVGDVRQGSMKRVAAAVGEGSSAVRSVHDHLGSRT